LCQHPHIRKEENANVWGTRPSAQRKIYVSDCEEYAKSPFGSMKRTAKVARNVKNS